MSKWRKTLNYVIYPHIIVAVILTATSILGLVYSFVFNDAIPFLQYLSYIISAYTLLVICFRVPRMIKFFKTFKQKNKYMQKWFSDVHLRMNVSLYGSLIWNAAFAIFQLGLGFYHKSFWFYSMFAYYIMLGIMRFSLATHTSKYKVNEETTIEVKKSILCGWLLIAMNLALAVIVFFMVYWNKTFYHHMITTIALAAYTFFTFAFAIINLVKHRKYKSAVYSSAKTIALIAGAVSMLTLEAAMLTTFGANESPLFSQLMLSLRELLLLVLP